MATVAATPRCHSARSLRSTVASLGEVEVAQFTINELKSYTAGWDYYTLDNEFWFLDSNSQLPRVFGIRIRAF